MKILVALTLLGTPLLADTSASYPPNPFEKAGGKKSPSFTAANAEASHFTNLIDQQQYSASWSDSAALLKDIITEEQWVAAMKGVRQPLGQVRTRKVQDHSFAQSLPGGTKGNFAIIEFQTTFTYKSATTEKVTLMTDERGQWRVCAYAVNES